MQEFPDHDVADGAQNIEPVKSEVCGDMRQDVAASPPQNGARIDKDAKDPGRALRRALLRSWQLILDYPKASVSAILTVVSAVVGFLLLPTHSVAVTSKADVSEIQVQTTPQVPTYLGFIARGDRLGQVVAGFQIRAHQTITWQIRIASSRGDQLV
jgi:hypothetical protein